MRRLPCVFTANSGNFKCEDRKLRSFTELKVVKLLVALAREAKKPLYALAPSSPNPAWATASLGA